MIEILAYFSLLVFFALSYFAYKAFMTNYIARGFLYLGLGFFNTFDIWKYIILQNNPNRVEDILLAKTIGVFYLSLVTCLLGIWYFNKTIKNFNEANYIHSLQNREIPQANLFIFQIVGLLIHFLFIGYDKFSDSHYIGLLTFIPATVSIYSYFNYQRKKKVIDFFFFIVLLILFIGPSSRRIYIVLFSIFITILISKEILKFGVVRKEIKVILLFVSVIIFLFMNYLRSGLEEGFKLKQSNYDKTKEYIASMKSIDVFYNTSFVLDNFPKYYNYQYGMTYLSVPTGFIPRSVFPNKPISFSTTLGMLVSTGNIKFNLVDWAEGTGYYSLSPSLSGEAYANFGIFGVIIISFIISYFTVLLDKKKFNLRMFFSLVDIKYLPFYSFPFLIMRGAFYDAMVNSIYFWLIIIVLNKLLFYKIQKKV